MGTDFSNVAGGIGGSMMTAKAVLVFFPPRGNGIGVRDVSSKVTFQFNPATLRISACGGGMAPVTNYSSGSLNGGGRQVDCGPLEETVTVSFKVVFDSVSNADAFLADRMNFAPTSLVKQGVDFLKGEVHSVRTVTEGFLTSVRERGTRRVLFYWGSMRYGGYLNRVQCRYTMFHMTGEPVRSEVELSLVGSCHNEYNNVEEWRKRYDAFMQEMTWERELEKRFLAGRVEKAYILFRVKDRDPMAKRATKFVPVRVQYNPASISMYSRGGEMLTRGGSAAGMLEPGQYQHNAMPAETVLSMELMFDDTENPDAFLLDSGTGSPTGMVKAGLYQKEKMAGREYSVAPVSELFVAATAAAYSRLVGVIWNEMAFWGELCEVDVEYTMFNRKGNPIRSRVSIRVRQGGVE